MTAPVGENYRSSWDRKPKLTREDAEAIRTEYADEPKARNGHGKALRSLADRWNVDPTTILDIVRGLRFPTDPAPYYAPPAPKRQPGRVSDPSRGVPP